MRRYNLIEARSRKGYTQKQIAQMIGITKAAYANIETGKRDPSWKTTMKLKRLFEQPIDYLLEQEVDTPRKA